jgi:hypothetical protein
VSSYQHEPALWRGWLQAGQQAAALRSELEETRRTADVKMSHARELAARAQRRLAEADSREHAAQQQQVPQPNQESTYKDLRIAFSEPLLLPFTATSLSTLYKRIYKSPGFL